MSLEDAILEAGVKFDGHVTNGSHAAIMEVIRAEFQALQEEIKEVEQAFSVYKYEHGDD